jgi:hypothetical protein
MVEVPKRRSIAPKYMLHCSLAVAPSIASILGSTTSNANTTPTACVSTFKASSGMVETYSSPSSAGSFMYLAQQYGERGEKGGA